MKSLIRYISVVCLAVFYALPLLCATGMQAQSDGSILYTRSVIERATVDVIDINLNDQSLLVTPCAVAPDTEKRKTFAEFQKDSHSLAQITGSFFCLQSGFPIGDIVIHGRQICSTQQVGSALVVTPRNVPAIIDETPSDGWRGYESVLQGGLRLVRNGMPDVDPLAQGFHDRYMQRNTSRIAVGVLPRHHLVMVRTSNVLLPTLASIMLDLGCTDAMALDGGGSTGISCQGKVITATKRPLADVLAVLRRSPAEIAARTRPRLIFRPVIYHPKKSSWLSDFWQRIKAFFWV